MASSSIVHFTSKMVKLHANSLKIPIPFSADANGFAFVPSVHLSIMFSLQNHTIWVECEIYNDATSLLSLTMHENSRVADNGSSM